MSLGRSRTHVLTGYARLVIVPIVSESPRIELEGQAARLLLVQGDLLRAAEAARLHGRDPLRHAGRALQTAIAIALRPRVGSEAEAQEEVASPKRRPALPVRLMAIL